MSPRIADGCPAPIRPTPIGNDPASGEMARHGARRHHPSRPGCIGMTDAMA
ncbi:hypothetical protein [Novacetimonas pomaceti]|uniref:hypothetical protein n=1 Tax=Novacetimonas pomaceti TaxID=2021998 RepID=UPI001C2CE240|nr:hypothetical protein [Novacetimonas pomaceti]MBV1834726.1 hypothetical protein [Novacetimonas pomaceti]